MNVLQIRKKFLLLFTFKILKNAEGERGRVFACVHLTVHLVKVGGEREKKHTADLTTNSGYSRVKLCFKNMLVLLCRQIWHFLIAQVENHWF